MKKHFIQVTKLTVGFAISLVMLSESNAMYGDRDDFTDRIPTSQLPAAKREAAQDLKEERKEARQTGDTTGVEIAKDRVDAVNNAIKDRK